MASAKSRYYDRKGGMKHTEATQAGRPNGKAFKEHPKAFSDTFRRLVTSHTYKGRNI